MQNQFLKKVPLIRFSSPLAILKTFYKHGIKTMADDKYLYAVNPITNRTIQYKVVEIKRTGAWYVEKV